MVTMNSSYDIGDSSHDAGDDDENIEHGRPNKTQLKREAHHLLDVGDQIIKLSADDLDSMSLPVELKEAVDIARKIKSNSGLKRQRQYIGKLLRTIGADEVEAQLRRILHRHDTNTAQFKRLERWRDQLLDNNRQAFDEIIERYPDIDRQHLNQLIRQATKEKHQEKAPASSRKLFRYLREMEETLTT
jgi:ribosome-associated protein